jgi:hypothetical protein
MHTNEYISSSIKEGELIRLSISNLEMDNHSRCTKQKMNYKLSLLLPCLQHIMIEMNSSVFYVIIATLKFPVVSTYNCRIANNRAIMSRK